VTDSKTGLETSSKPLPGGLTTGFGFLRGRRGGSGEYALIQAPGTHLSLSLRLAPISLAPISLRTHLSQHLASPRVLQHLAYAPESSRALVRAAETHRIRYNKINRSGSAELAPADDFRKETSMSLRTPLVVVIALCLSTVVALASSGPSTPPAALVAAVNSANPMPALHCLDLSAGQPSAFQSLPWASTPALDVLGRQQTNKSTTDCLKYRTFYYPTPNIYGTPCGNTDVYCSGKVVHTGCTTQYHRTITSPCICP
jgi:hypothetical protein